MGLAVLFYVLAVIVFGIATVVGPAFKSINLVALGLAFFTLGHLLT